MCGWWVLGGTEQWQLGCQPKHCLWCGETEHMFLPCTFTFTSRCVLAQGIMFNLLFVAYLVSPKFCHSLVGFLEEAAVVTYTHAIKVRFGADLQSWGGEGRMSLYETCGSAGQDARTHYHKLLSALLPARHPAADTNTNFPTSSLLPSFSPPVYTGH